MAGDARRIEAVQKLLRIARAEADALRKDLADIEAAKASTAGALEALERDIREEEKKVGGGADLAQYIDTARTRRCNLTGTLRSLEASEERARDELQAAFVEIKKLDHLVDMHVIAERRRAAKTDAARLDDVATALARR